MKNLVKLSVKVLLVSVLFLSFCITNVRASDKPIINVMTDDIDNVIIKLGEEYAKNNNITLDNGLRFSYKENFYSVGWNTVTYYTIEVRNNSCNYIPKFELTFETLPTFSAYVDEDHIEVYEYSGMCEFSIDNVNWQNSKEFNNLKRHTNYTVYVRTKANNNYDHGTTQTLELKTK